MKHCRYLDMDSCGVPSEEMAKIRDAYPEMDVVWRIWFGYNFSCRTDIELMVNSYNAEGMTDELTKDLKYCTKVKRLDMGHNLDLHDWSFLSYRSWNTWKSAPSAMNTAACWISRRWKS